MLKSLGAWYVSYFNCVYFVNIKTGSCISASFQNVTTSRRAIHIKLTASSLAASVYSGFFTSCIFFARLIQ